MRMRPFVFIVTVLALAAPVRAQDALDTAWDPLAGLEEQDAADAPAVAIARDSARLKITFAGTLESADAIGGPWTEVTNAASPFGLEPADQQRFFRTRSAGGLSIFSSHSVVSWTLSGPFQAHFDAAFAGTPDGFFPPHREKLYFDGRLAMAGFDLPVSLRVRGNSSLQECPFPKLKVKIDKEHRPGTPFFDAREIKIGTHCAEGGRGTIGRLRDETATFREALAYETLDLLGFIAPRVRRAEIDYQDTTPTNTGAQGGWQLSREAVILDDVEVVAERLGARVLSAEEIAGLTNAAFGVQLITDLRLFHALIGNWDYAVSEEGRGLWNIDVLELSDKKLAPVAGDFDLSSLVTGVVRFSAPRDYRPDLGDVEREALYRIEQLEQGVAQPVFGAARDRFTARRNALESLIASALIDEIGRTNAFRHVSAFFDSLAAVAP